MAKNQSVKNVKNVEKSEKTEKSKKQRQQKDFEAIQPKFIDKLINSYNINVLDEQYQKPIASLKQLPIVFAKLYIMRDPKEEKNEKNKKNDNKEEKDTKDTKDSKIKPAEKFAKIISEVKGIQTCSNVKLMKLKYLQNAKLISKKISEQFESEYQEFLSNYQLTVEEVPKGKTRKVQVIAKFNNQNSEEMQEQIRLNNVNKCMMSLYKLVTDSLAEELKDKTDESEIADIYKAYIKEQLAVEVKKDEKPTEFQKAYNKYEALLNGSIEPEQEYKLKQTFMKLWTAHKKEWKIPELKMGYQVAIASADLLNKIMQEWQDKIRIIYLTKQYDVNSKLLVSEFGKQKKEAEKADVKALNQELNEQKQQNIQDNIEALVGEQTYPLTIEYQIEDKDIKPREPKEKADKSEKKSKKSKKEEKDEESEESEEPKEKTEKKHKKDKKDKKSKKEEKEESEEQQEMSDVVDSILDEQKEESEEPKEKTDKKHKKDKKDKSEKSEKKSKKTEKSSKKDEE